MPRQFHEALHLLFQALAITGITPPSWIQSHTILLYKKGDPSTLDNYRPITLANAIYKLWTTCVILATDCIESRKILSPEQEGFRADRSCAIAETHISLCVEDVHNSKKDIVLCYLDFKGVFPSTYHTQLLVRVLDFLGLPQDFTRLISNLYSGASTCFVTPHGLTPPIGIRRGTLQGDPLSPLLFDLMIESTLDSLAKRHG
jgi:hypothetical protein